MLWCDLCCFLTFQVSRSGEGGGARGTPSAKAELHLWKGTHSGAVHKELHPVRRTHVGEMVDCLLWDAPHAGAGRTE